MEIRFALITLAPIGPVWAGWTVQGLCWLVPHPDEASFRQAIAKRHPGAQLVPDEAGGARWAADLAAWLRGEVADLPVDDRGLTPFERKVLAACRSIPRGEVRSYGELAKMIGQPTASRAVGGVMARNPVPLLLPCHRVVQSGGKLGHYGLGGPSVKEQLLALEGALPVRKQGLLDME
jgi:O-6-methylguanine DNA methyltransferase